tara:strand:- start:2579 stop:3649 length:1071 start_codon:yes stop_codon:yes gene_type:complete
MAAAADNISVTYNGTYAASMLLEPIFRSDDVMQNYTVLPNVKYKQNVLLATGLNKIVMANGGCGSTDNSGTGLTTSFNIDDKVIEVSNCSVKMSQCFDTFTQEVIVESYKTGINMPDLTGTELARVITDRVRKGLAQDIVRVMWGGDTSSSDVTYKWADGLFELFNDASIAPIQQAVTSGTGHKAVGGTILSGDAVSLLTKIFDSAPANLQQVPASEKKMFVTPNIYNAYFGALTLINAAGSTDGARAEAISGASYTRLFFRGVEICPMYEWDTIFTDLTPALWNINSGGGAADYKNGVVYAAKSNLMIGSDVTSQENQFKMFYDEVTDNMYIRSLFKMGYQFGYNSLVACGALVD